jgi:hypothetical protein
MGLDAEVYCDCLERGVATPPPPGIVLLPQPDGSIECGACSWDEEMLFEKWREHSMCEHTNGILVWFRLGNAGRIGFVNQFLSSHPEHYPILLQKVFYNGTHAGDQLALPDVAALGPELKRWAGQISETTEPGDDRSTLWDLHSKLTALRELALRASRPIVF